MDMRKCGVVTFHSAHNYGSVLQAYAIIKILQDLGLDAEIIDYRHPHTTDMYEWKLWSSYKSARWNLMDIAVRGILGLGKERERQFREFIESKLPKSERFLNRSDIPDNEYDILICGSDQIWNPTSTGENDPVYFLDFGNTGCRFSYAASSGSRPFGEGCRERVQGYLSRFRSIGVREKFMQDYIKKEFGLDSTVNPDPTLLLPSENWAEIEVGYKRLPSEYLLVYSLWEHKDILRFAQAAAGHLGLPLVHISTDLTLRAVFHKGIRYSLSDVSPQQFLWLFHHASFVVTNTFHGNMFSVIFRKNFVNYTVRGLNDMRMKTLHNAIGLEGRTVASIEEFIGIEKEIDYSENESAISDFQKQGRAFIKENILC